MAIINAHSSEIRGVRQFAAQIEKMREVGTIKLSDIRSSHVAPGSRPPKVKLKPKAVHVVYYNEGKCQTVVAVPAPNVTLDQLVAALSERFRDPDDRPKKSGQSSHDPVVVPDHIRRQQRLHVVSPHTSEVVTTMSAPTDVTPAPVPTTEPVKLTARIADAYNLLLAQDPTGHAPSFNIERVNGIMRTKFDDNDANSRIASLKRHGLLMSGPKVTSGFATIRSFTVHRRPYTIISEPTPETPMAKTPKVTKTFDPLEHLTWLTKYQDVIEEAERRRRELKKHGYEAVEVKGRLMLAPIKR